MKEVLSIPIEILKKYEVKEVDTYYFIKVVEMLKEEYPKEEYDYTRFFQRLGNKVFMHVRIRFKDA